MAAIIQTNNNLENSTKKPRDTSQLVNRQLILHGCSQRRWKGHGHIGIVYPWGHKHVRTNNKCTGIFLIFSFSHIHWILNDSLGLSHRCKLHIFIMANRRFVSETSMNPRYSISSIFLEVLRLLWKKQKRRIVKQNWTPFRLKDPKERSSNHTQGKRNVKVTLVLSC